MTTGAFGFLRGQRVAVLGASGFIGRWVARTVAGAGVRPLLVTRSPAAAAMLASYGAGGDLSVVDVATDGAIETWLGEHRPTVVFNLVGYGVDRGERNEQVAEDTNAVLPARIARVLAHIARSGGSNATLIHVGSALEYGTVSGNLAEDGPARPTTPYGRSKLAGTLAVAAVARDTGLRAVTARLFTVYGPGEHAGRLLPTLLAARDSSAPVPLTEGRQHRDFTWVGDVADCLVRLAGANLVPGSVINLASGSRHTVRSFVDIAATVLGLDPRRLQFGAIPTRGEEMDHDDVTNERLGALVGMVPSSDVASGVSRTAGFLKSL